MRIEDGLHLTAGLPPHPVGSWGCCDESEPNRVPAATPITIEPAAHETLVHIWRELNKLMSSEHLLPDPSPWTRRRVPMGTGPYASIGHANRTRSCVHCGRTCGNQVRGWGMVNGAPVCSLVDATDAAPDCYAEIRRFGHDVYGCSDCGVPR